MWTDRLAKEREEAAASVIQAVESANRSVKDAEGARDNSESKLNKLREVCMHLCCL